MARPRDEARIFFPWERRGGLALVLRRGRVRPLLVAALVVGFVVFVALRERRAAGVRQTRVTLAAVSRQIDRYLADHDGACPADLAQLMPAKTAPLDAWGRPLAFTCPSRREGRVYQLSSHGPDGVPGGLDRIE